MIPTTSIHKRTQGTFKPYETERLQSLSSRTFQLETISNAPPRNHRPHTARIIYMGGHPPAPLPPQGQAPKAYKVRIVVPRTVWLFANYVLERGLYRFTSKDLERALGLHSKGAKYQTIRELIRNGLIKSNDNGLYEVNVEMAELTARLIPHPAGRRVYAQHWVKETLPEWRTADVRYRQWLSAVMSISQGTSPPIADWAQFPVVNIRVPHGNCLPAIMVAGLYVIPSKSLARRTVVYCVDLGPVTLCSASRAQLFRYLSPPCPDCHPVVPYPVPCVKVESQVADFKGRLIPLSDLPRTARRYEPGVVLAPRSPGLPVSDLFNVEVSRRGSHPPHLRVVPRSGFARHIGSDALQFCQGVDAFTDYVLPYLMAVYGTLAVYGRSATGLTAGALMAKSQELFDLAYHNRRRRPTASPSPLPQVYLRRVWVEERVGRRWQAKLLDKELRRDWLTCEDIRAYVHARGYRVRFTYFELWVFLPDRDGSLSRDMSVEYDYLYHSEEKDRPGTVRLEARPYGGVTSNLSPQDILTHLYAKAHRIATAIGVVMLTRHRTARWPAPND